VATRMIAWVSFIGGVLIALSILQLAIHRETVSGLEVLNPEGGAGAALIVFHPGLSDLQERVTAAFAAGLVERGWRVERTTTSREAPTDLSAYDLLVLGVHTYWFAPDGPTRRYLRRVADLQGTPTVVLLTALGAAGRAAALSERMVREAGGELVAVQPLFVMRPNDENDPRPNREVALEKAHDLGARVAAWP
jgi:hypothetical protein